MVALGVWLWGCCVGKLVKILQESLEDIGRVQTQDPTRAGLVFRQDLSPTQQRL